MKFIINILTLPFYLAIYLRNYLFDIGLIKQHKTKAKVISVGNLSVGGTGKTPFTIWLVDYLKSLNKSIVVIGRPYKRDNESSVIVSDGNLINEDTEVSGDEMVLIAQKANVPVVANKRKWKAALKADKELNPDIIIVDDGFQHRYLMRDLDIVLITKESIKRPYLLPFGRLREPLTNFKRAHIIGFKNEDFSEEFVGLNKFFISKEVNNKSILDSNGTVIDDIPEKIALVSSIANNKSFHYSVKEYGIEVIKSFDFSDHYSYGESDIERIISVMKNKDICHLGTTSKDFVKLKSFISYFYNNDLKLLVFERETKIIQNLELLKKAINESIN